MKDKNLPNNINFMTLNELTDIANNIIENLENEKNLENSVEEYKKLIKLNILIEKKFQNTSKKISIGAKEKINQVLKKRNAKKT